MKISIINGPNLNLLGTREPEVYGHETLDQLESRCRQAADRLAIEMEFLQSNYEGQIIDWIQQAIGTTDAIVINPAGYTHTSVAIHDALKAYPGYKVELHISDPASRESFRHHSYVASAVDESVTGRGTDGYIEVIEKLVETLG